MQIQPTVTPRSKIQLKPFGTNPKSPGTNLKLDFSKLESHTTASKPRRPNQSPRDQAATPIKIDEPIPPINMFLLHGLLSPKHNNPKLSTGKSSRRNSINTDRSYSRSNHLDRLTEIENLESQQVNRHETIKYLERKTRGNIYCPELWGKTFYEGILKSTGIHEIFQDKKRLVWVSNEAKTDLQESHLNKIFPEFCTPAKKHYSVQNLKKINNYSAHHFFTTRQHSLENNSANDIPSNRNSTKSPQSKNFPSKTSNFAKMVQSQAPEILTYYNEDIRRSSQPVSKSRPDDLIKPILLSQTPNSGTKETMSTAHGFPSSRSLYKPITPISFGKGLANSTMNFSNVDMRRLSPDAFEMLEKLESLQQDMIAFQTENSSFKQLELKTLTEEAIKDFQPAVLKDIAKKASSRRDKLLVKLKRVVHIENPGKPKITVGLTPFQIEMKKKIAEIESKFLAGSALKKRLHMSYGNKRLI